MTKLAEVKTLYTHNATNVVKVLRSLADDVESGAILDVAHAVVSMRNKQGKCTHYSLGETSAHEAHSLYHIGMLALANLIEDKPISEPYRHHT